MQSKPRLSSSRAEAKLNPERKEISPADRLGSYFEASVDRAGYRPAGTLSILSRAPTPQELKQNAYQSEFILITDPRKLVMVSSDAQGKNLTLMANQGDLFYITSTKDVIPVRIDHFRRLQTVLPRIKLADPKQVPVVLARTEISGDAIHETIEANGGFSRPDQAELTPGLTPAGVSTHTYKKGTPFETLIELRQAPTTAEEFYTLAVDIYNGTLGIKQGSEHLSILSFQNAIENSPLSAERDELIGLQMYLTLPIETPEWDQEVRAKIKKIEARLAQINLTLNNGNTAQEARQLLLAEQARLQELQNAYQDLLIKKLAGSKLGEVQQVEAFYLTGQECKGLSPAAQPLVDRMSQDRAALAKVSATLKLINPQHPSYPELFQKMKTLKKSIAELQETAGRAVQQMTHAHHQIVERLQKRTEAIAQRIDDLRRRIADEAKRE